MRPCFRWWDFRARDFIEISVIEKLDERLHRGADFGMIVKPAGRGIDFAFHGDFNLKTMSVHPATFVAFRRVRKRLGRLECEVFGQANTHGDKLALLARACHPEAGADVHKDSGFGFQGSEGRAETSASEP